MPSSSSVKNGIVNHHRRYQRFLGLGKSHMKRRKMSKAGADASPLKARTSRASVNQSASADGTHGRWQGGVWWETLRS